MNSMKRQNNMTLKDELSKFKGVQYATGEEWRNSSGKNEAAGPRQKQNSDVDASGSESKVHAIKNNITQDPGLLGPRIKANGKW